MAAPGSVDSDPIEDSAEVEEVSPASCDFGRYVLRYRLASGGMASVYLARATGPGGYARPAALKLMHPHLARRKRFVEMFLDEARIAAQISHPNVCTVLDFGEVDGTYYMAMEYLAGVSLSRLIRRVSDEQIVGSQRWSAMCARILADAAEGLHAAHSLRDDADGRPLNVVHRDVSPQNLFVTFDGAVKVVDFGVAHAERRLTRTRSGTLKGKLSYMAPEHAQGAAIDRRADVWSLGVCLWEGLTGKRLFRTKNEMDTLLAVRSRSIDPPSSVRPELPEELDRITLRALERDLEARYATARELSRDLAEFVHGQPLACGLPELEDLLGPLFREERRETRERLRTVVEPRSGEIPRATASMPAPPPEAEVAAGETVSVPSPDATAPNGEVTATVPAGSPEPGELSGQPGFGSAARPRWRRALAWGGLAVLATALVTAAVVGPGSEEEPARSAEIVKTRRALAEVQVDDAPSGSPAAPSLEEPEPSPEAQAEPVAARTEVEPSPEPAASGRRRRRSTRAARTTPQGAPANVVITARPYARIRVDGRDLGNTPRPVTLRAGTHRVQYQFRESGPWRTRTVRVEAGERRTLRLTPPS